MSKASIVPISTPHTDAIKRYDALQQEELFNAEAIADYASQFTGTGKIARLPVPQRMRWVGRAAAFVRSQFAPWRMAAMDAAVASVGQSIVDGHVGALFVGMKPEKRLAIARELASAAITSYNAVLTGDAVMGPGRYLHIVNACQSPEASDAS